MARIVGIDIPNEKRVETGLTYVKGIGVSTSRKLLSLTGIDPDKRVKDLSEEEIANLQGQIASLGISVEGELRRVVTSNIRRLIETKSYRGSRHQSGLPTRGQNTSHNARTRKGKKKTVGGLKKKLAKK